MLKYRKNGTVIGKKTKNWEKPKIKLLQLFPENVSHTFFLWYSGRQVVVHVVPETDTTHSEIIAGPLLYLYPAQVFLELQRQCSERRTSAFVSACTSGILVVLNTAPEEMATSNLHWKARIRHGISCRGCKQRSEFDRSRTQAHGAQ